MKNYEFIQRIPSHYVGDDCIQLMIPHYANEGITILSSDDVLYHYKPNSTYFVNKYLSDKRKEQFPYSQIPSHKRRIKGKKYEFINQLFNFNKVYIKIGDGIIEEIYVIKDGNEALLANKFIIPEVERKTMNHEEVEDLLKTATAGMYSLDGGMYESYPLVSEERLVEFYKQDLINKRKDEHSYNSEYGRNMDSELTDYFYRSLDKITIDDVPSGIVVHDDAILITVENNEIKSIKSIIVTFNSTNCYSVEIYNFPITIYSLEHMKQLEQISYKNTYEPRIPRHLNSKIDRKEIKKAKKLVLSRKQKNRN